VNYHQGTTEEDAEIISLLTRVFVQEGYTSRQDAERMFTPAELRKRGNIILARSPAGSLFGMAIFVPSSSQARQVATAADEAEIHLLAVHPGARGRGIASSLILDCEREAVSLGYFKMVLSTQPTMKEAHRVYERLGYRRNSGRDWSRGTGRLYFVYEKSLEKIN
jgi:ribosomal protein S18 acetylase RimI-like enzyme